MVLWSIFLLCCLVLEVWSDFSLENITRSTLLGVDEYRSAFTLDSLAVEDLKQRELVSEPVTDIATPKFMSENCKAYPRPSYGKVTKLMLELFRNLESNTGFVVSDLMRVRVRLKLLMKFSMMDPDEEQTPLTEPKLMKHEIHATFSRVLAILWLEMTDGTTSWNNDWCPTKKVTEYVAVTTPMEIVKHFRELKPLLSQVRDIMEEFINSITPPSHHRTVWGQKVYAENYYTLGNITEAPMSEIDAYRSALNLDWKAAKDFRQHELVPSLPAKSEITTCSEYPNPPFGQVVKQMLELLRNLESENGGIILELVSMLMKSKLLIENPGKGQETGKQSQKEPPKIIISAPHFTLSRILAIVWILVSDVTLTNKRGWCPVVSVNEYLALARSNEIEKELHVLGPLVARARFIMEEFIQAITPLNIYQEDLSGPAHLAKVDKNEEEFLWIQTSPDPFETSSQYPPDNDFDEMDEENFAHKSTEIFHLSIVIASVLFLLLFYGSY